MTRSLLLQRVAGGVLPALLLFAAFLLLRGHDAPGGGFIAGLVTAAAVVLAALAFGRSRVQRAIAPIVRPSPWIGLAVAAASGLVGVARGESYLTHYHVHAPLSRHVAIDLSTTLLFDVGVYLVVVGAASAILGAFAEGVAR